METDESLSAPERVALKHKQELLPRLGSAGGLMQGNQAWEAQARLFYGSSTELATHLSRLRITAESLGAARALVERVADSNPSTGAGRRAGFDRSQGPVGGRAG